MGHIVSLKIGGELNRGDLEFLIGMLMQSNYEGAVIYDADFASDAQDRSVEQNLRRQLSDTVRQEFVVCHYDDDDDQVLLQWLMKAGLSFDREEEAEDEKPRIRTVWRKGWTKVKHNIVAAFDTEEGVVVTLPMLRNFQKTNTSVADILQWLENRWPPLPAFRLV